MKAADKSTALILTDTSELLGLCLGISCSCEHDLAWRETYAKFFGKFANYSPWDYRFSEISSTFSNGQAVFDGELSRKQALTGKRRSERYNIRDAVFYAWTRYDSPKPQDFADIVCPIRFHDGMRTSWGADGFAARARGPENVATLAELFAAAMRDDLTIVLARDILDISDGYDDDEDETAPTLRFDGKEPILAIKSKLLERGDCKSDVRVKRPKRYRTIREIGTYWMRV